MLDPSRYFDHAASTPLAAEVWAEMEPYFGLPGNAHSIHAFGRRAMAAVDLARQRVAEAIGAEYPEQVVFTSGATEACNTVLAAYSGGAFSAFEHSAVREPALARGFDILPLKGTTIGQPDGIPELTVVMALNNEVGFVWDVRDYVGKKRFTDATQALGKVSVELEGVDYAAFSAHKIYGPQGVGALFTTEGLIDPLLRGGDQEEGRRAGTLNVAGIVGFGVAAAMASERLSADAEHAAELRGIVLEEISKVAGLRVTSGDVPHILSLSFLDLEGETLVIEADQAGFAISAGAACSSRSTEPSHVLTALGVEERWRRGTVRISFGRANTGESAAALGKTLVRSAENLRTIA